ISFLTIGAVLFMLIQDSNFCFLAQESLISSPQSNQVMMKTKTILLSVILTIFGLLQVSAKPIVYENIARGVVTDDKGNPIEGVVISDGYSCTTSDAEGKYTLKRNPAAMYIWASIPAEYEIPLRQGQPCFYRKYIDKRTFDFVLTPLKKGKETKFNLFLVGDPQCQTSAHVERMMNEGIADIKAYSKKQKGPNYGITLGDIGYCENIKNTNYLFPIIREEMAADKVGMPLMQTVGNHDFEYAEGALDFENPTATIRRNRMFEATFGPIDYSWNRGDVHIISVNDVQFDDLKNPGNYHGDLTDAQFEWIKQDLSYVPKDKLVIFCTHIPLRGMKKTAHYKELISLLGQFANAKIITGHTHTMIHSIHEVGDARVEEYTVAALSGCWWWSRNCADGTPNGYMVFHINGNQVVDNIYKGVGWDDSFQMRVYRGDATYGGEYEDFKIPYSHDELLINVWNWQPGWKIDVYEDGVLCASPGKPLPLTSEYKPEPGTSKDWWAIGYNLGVVGRGRGGSNRKSYCSKNYHMFLYKMQNADAKVKVVVTDPSGRKFTTSHIFETAEYDVYAAPPHYCKSMQW
ncbi:MAG: calcineurin-like phosphoesterase family protein, partial [Treponemataceae bacterium]|nr:calcineurin-like phosphoesterase family protein [Treponemataceae bacterium]